MTYKLIFFSILMVVIPIMAFYASYVFIYDWKEEGLAWSGFIAVAATNLVIVAYVVMAWNEDKEDMKAMQNNSATVANTAHTKKEN